MSQQKPRQRGGRVLDKATPEQVMGLARNLPLTHSVPGKALEDATPGRLGFLANLFEKENASRAESKRRRLPGQAGFPQSKTLEGYDRGHGLVPRRPGPRTAGKPGVRRPGRGPRALRRRRLRQDPPGHRDRHARMPTHDTREVPRRLEPGHALEEGRGRQQIGRRAQVDGQGRAGHHRRARPSAHRHRRGRASVPGRRGRLRDPRRRLRLEPRVRRMGRRVRRRGHGRRGHRPHRPPRRDPPLPRRILPEQTLPYEINQTNNKTRNQPPTVFKLNADRVQIKCRTRPPQFDEIQWTRPATGRGTRASPWSSTISANGSSGRTTDTARRRSTCSSDSRARRESRRPCSRGSRTPRTRSRLALFFRTPVWRSFRIRLCRSGT